MKRQKYTSRALLLSLSLHVILMFVFSVSLINHFDAEDERISAEILVARPENEVRQRVLTRRARLRPRMAYAETSEVPPASPTYETQVNVPKALVRADVIPDAVTDTDISEIDELSPVSNISIGEDMAARILNDVDPRLFDGYAQHKIGNTEKVLNGPDTGLGLFDIAVMPGHGLIAEVFVPGTPIHRMPNFEGMLPVYTFVASHLNVPTRNYTKGFPMPDMRFVVENFAIRFRAELKIDRPGLYTFLLNSDDGSQLYINGKLIVDNEGIHSTRSRQRTIKLGIGIHPVEIRYFQGPRYAIALQWLYRPPNSPMKVVPPEVIYQPDASQSEMD